MRPEGESQRPSYEVMLRFYSLYKQAVCGPCMVPRPGFWDPVGRYKWSVCCLDCSNVIHTMPMDETTAPFFHHFEPLYRVIDDMPLPPASLFNLIKGGLVPALSAQGYLCFVEMLFGPKLSKVFSDPAMELNMPDDEHLPPTNNVPKGTAGLELDVKSSPVLMSLLVS
ncbi:hypothetical protein XENOCAPTIV_030248 [Xenoophorus captivus]|uniref:ACB domain-containing protein n=1 Tax=Xenoophorus captivus TaxID=1517983 RepID=A0ABV0SEX5_9TELE